MKEILLTRGEVAFVDDEAYETLKWYNWYPSYNSVRTPYPVRDYKLSGKLNRVYLHRLIAGLPSGYKIKWKNGNRLDSRMENLSATDPDGTSVQILGFRGISEFNGVSWCAYNGVWEARVRGLHIGYFDNELEAAIRFNERAMEFHLFSEVNDIDVACYQA